MQILTIFYDRCILLYCTPAGLLVDNCQYVEEHASQSVELSLQ